MRRRGRKKRKRRKRRKEEEEEEEDRGGSGGGPIMGKGMNRGGRRERNDPLTLVMNYCFKKRRL